MVSEMAQLGIRPPAKWRAMGIRSEKEDEEARIAGEKAAKKVAGGYVPWETA